MINPKQWKTLYRQVPQGLQTVTQTLDVAVLGWAAMVGMITGLIGTFFQIWVHQILNQRELLARSLSDRPWLYWTIPCLISAGMVTLSFWLMRKFSPDTGGSGIPQIEGRLEGIMLFNWQRVLPIKFFGGLLSLGAGMVGGFEGPTIQIGGSIGLMVGQWFRANQEQVRVLIASGAAAGLTAAFNAPLAGIVFITEEVKPTFLNWDVAYRAIAIACTFATIVERSLRGQGSVISLTKYVRVPLETLWIFVLLGIFFGILGYLFNHYLFRALDWFSGLPSFPYRATGLWVGGTIGLLSLVSIPITGTGEAAIMWAFNNEIPSVILILVFILRFFLTLFCYGSGAIGGIFAPMLAIATIASLGFAKEIHHFFPSQVPEPGVMALAGMGALVSATVRAPLTSILLTIEMTDNYFVILPLLITCLVSSMVAQVLGGQPIYTVLLQRIIAKQAKLKPTVEIKDEENGHHDNDITENRSH
jgi:CIC family chloride channel protein